MVQRAFAELTDAGVLKKTGEGLVEFIKDYDSWTFKGEPRLTAKEGKACVIAPAEISGFLRGSRLKECTGSATPPVSEALQGGVPEALHNCTGSATPPVPEALHPSNENPSYKARARAHAELETKRDRETLIGDDLRGRDAKHETEANLSPPQPRPEPVPMLSPRCPDYLTPERSIVPVQEGEHKQDQVWAESYWRRLFTICNANKVLTGWFERQEWYPAAVWEEVLVRAARDGIKLNSVRWLETTAADVAANGARPTPVKPDSARPDMIPMKPRFESFQDIAEREAAERKRLILDAFASADAKNRGQS